MVRGWGNPFGREREEDEQGHRRKCKVMERRRSWEFGREFRICKGGGGQQGIEGYWMLGAEFQRALSGIRVDARMKTPEAIEGGELSGDWLW